MKWIIIPTLVALSAPYTHAGTYNYICKDHGKAFPLKVDDALNILEWKGAIYKISENDDCAKFGWHAERMGLLLISVRPHKATRPSNRMALRFSAI
jgi:hypothetical protein